MRKLIPTWKISRKAVLNNFSFIQSQFGFPKFKKRWMRDEYYITTRKEDIEFSCTIFMFSSDSPSVEIINHAEPLKFNGNTPTNWYPIKNFALNDELKNVNEIGRENIEDYVKEIAELLKLKPQILSGNLTDYNQT